MNTLKQTILEAISQRRIGGPIVGSSLRLFALSAVKFKPQRPQRTAKGYLRWLLLLLFASGISEAQVSVSLPTVTGRPNTTVTAPLSVGNLTGLGVTAFQCVVTFDTAVVRLSGVDNTGTLSADFTTVINPNYPGELRIASAGITPIVGSGTLVNLKFDLNNVGSSTIDFASFKFNEGIPQATLTGGKITVNPNQKPVFISHFPVDGSGQVVSSGKPVTFSVSAYDPQGWLLTFTWKRDRQVVKSGADTSYTTTFTGPQGEPHLVTCIAADSAGLQDSTSWNFIITAVKIDDGTIPKEFSLSQNYPNPFNPSTALRFDLPREARVTMEIYNILGVRVRTLLKGETLGAGNHVMRWDGRDESGQMVPSGVYLYRIAAGDFHAWRKMTLLK
ncbi:MAG: cohesin domain-containing protein [Ignavibacteriales bacterium]|nr:cohesin domain-containing protein [Ignavibacteriales bacterium]